MCRVVQARFADEPIAAARARGFVGETLTGWKLADVAEDVQLAVTELVTNAILHARTPLVVTLCVADGLVEVAVTDHDPRTPRSRPQRSDLLADLDALDDLVDDDPDPRQRGLHYGPSGSVAAGRGLIILEAISSSWGVTRHPDGKDVWARLAVPEQWPFSDDCRCGDEGDLKTASGRPVLHIGGPWDED